MKRTKKKRRSARRKRARKETPLPLDPVIEFLKKKVDRAALRENLKLTVEQRFEKLMEQLRNAEAEELRKAPGSEPPE
jgi:hypothetical protein